MLRLADDDLAELGRDDAERRFLGRLTELQPPYCDVWLFSPELIVTVSIFEKESPVLRTLRVDFDGGSFVAGNDPSHQISGDLDPDDPDRIESLKGLGPEELAEAAMAWFRAQAARPIERHEWGPERGCWQRWVLVDTGQALTVRREGGIAWTAGGAWGDSIPSTPPDRVVRLPSSADS